MVLQDVEEELRARVRKQGRITFAEFSDVALYWPHGGYYASRRPVGSEGDFYTAPWAHPIFGELIAEQLERFWRLLGSPDPFWVVEPGAGAGQLAGIVLAHVRRELPAFASALHYVGIDVQPPVVESQDRPLWLTADELPLHGIIGCFLANELLDAMPVHRVTVQNGRLLELYVSLDNHGDFAEQVGEPSTSALAQRFEELGIRLPEGCRTEVNLGLARWLEAISSALTTGYVLIIDYGHEAATLYDETRTRGTLRCYYRHTVNANPYQHVGRQDISAHVDFTTLKQIAVRQGFTVAAYTTQARFLSALGLAERRAVVAQRRDMHRAAQASELRAIDTLVDPAGMGDFKVLALGNNVPENASLPF